MSVVLGRNIDAVVVDEEKTAIECIEVITVRKISIHARLTTNSTCAYNVLGKRRSSHLTPSK